MFRVELKAGSYAAFHEAVEYDLDTNRQRHPRYVGGRESGSTYSSFVELESPMQLVNFLDWLREYNQARKRRSNRSPVKLTWIYAMSVEAITPQLQAIVSAACAMFDSPKAGIGQLKEAVRAYEEK